MSPQMSDPLGTAHRYFDQARYGIRQATALADGIRVGLADLAAAVRLVMVRTARLDEERWAVLSERAKHVRAACQEMLTHVTATHTATTRVGTQLVGVDVDALGRRARQHAYSLAVASIGISRVLRLTLPVGARVCARLAEIEDAYARRAARGLAASVELIERAIDDLAAIAELLAATSAIPSDKASTQETFTQLVDHG